MVIRYADGRMELDHVEAFVAIVRRGGFTRAATTLHLSQPAISRRVHLLEQELRAPLFERVRTGVILTDAGRAFLPHAEALLASMRDGIDAVGALRGATHGIVTLAIVGTLASTGLTERLRRFREAHPAIDLRIRTALSAEVSELVRRGDATLGLRYGNDPHPELPTDLNQWTSRTARPAHRLGRGVARVHNVAEDKLVEQDDELIIRRFLHVAHLFAFVRRATPLALPPRRPRAARCSGGAAASSPVRHAVPSLCRQGRVP
jgi:DNA-binding transcriptional LysR family regulator